MTLDPIAKDVMELLVKGKPDEARNLVEKTLASIDQQRDQLLKVQALIPPKNKPLIPPRQTSASHKGPLTKQERKTHIKFCADELGKRNGGKVEAQEVVNELVARGIDLGVDVPNVTVANVLLNAGWTRLERGVFHRP